MESRVIKLLIVAVVLGPVLAVAQGIRYQNTALISGGFPYATITVCTEPASGTPCTPLASIYSDPGLSVPLSNPFTADANGNFGFFASPANTYHVQISGTGITTYDIPYITLGGGGGSTSPGSPTTSVQFNNSGVFGGDSTFEFNNSTKTLATQNQSNSGTITTASENVTGTLSLGGTLAAAPLYITSTIPGSSPSPTAGKSVLAVGADGNPYYSNNGGTLGILALGAGYGVDASRGWTGVDPCVQIQAAIYGSPSGSIINALGFSSFAACSVNPFQAPSQTNPTTFTGLPIKGLLLLPAAAIPSDVPWYVPTKWTVLGVSGYGTDKTVIQPSGNFLANRVVVSASGGTSGCSATGTSTVTISGTTFSNVNNLLGMFLLCSSNASPTAVPTVQNAQIGGVVTAVSGTGPYTLTLSGSGASGTVTNTGWTINPVIMGWQPNAPVFGSTLNQLTVSCATPGSGNVTGCFGFLDLTGNEGAILSNFSVLNFDAVGIGVFTAQSQNGGPFGPITLNWSASGNNSTIGIEVGGTGWNSSGGGVTGLCATGNPCAGVANRGFFGITLLGSGNGTGNGGYGFDINATNVRVRDSHCESLITCVLIGDAAAAQNVEVDSVTGCTSSSCAITSVADISSAYSTGSAPAPTQNITLRNVARAYSTTWDLRDFIHLTGVISDPSVSDYTIGSSGSSGRMVFTNSQQMGCITTGGVADSNGAHCAPASQMKIISRVGGHYYADSWNNNGTSDVCQQINNTMQWAATSMGLTDGVLIDATGLNRNSGYPCATNPFSGTLGTTIPAGGVLQLGLAKLFLSTQWQVPANWILQGSGGNGIGANGATGTLLSPNINNTSNANYANDTVAGTVSTTAGSYTWTGSGSSWTSALVGHYILACATLPCTNQSTMAGGIVTAVSSGTQLTTDVPAQAGLSGASYTVTAPLIQNAGIIRDVGIDGNSYGTGGSNGNGGFVGVYQAAGSGGDSYLDNVSVAHVNAVGIDASGLNNLQLSKISVIGNGVASSVFTCVTAPQGVNLNTLLCESGTTPTPTLSYGVMASGSGFRMNNLIFQNVAIGAEVAVNPNFSTNNVALGNLVSGSSTTAVTTLVDIGGVSSGSNGPALQVDLNGLNCPSGCTNAVVNHLYSETLTDSNLGYYYLSRTCSNGLRTRITDSVTTGISDFINCGATLTAGQFLTAPSWLDDSEGSMFIRSGNAGQFGTGTANLVMFWMFKLKQATTFNTIWFNLNNNGSGAVIGIGVYSTSGTRLIHWDNIPTTATSPTNTSATPTGGAVTLQPGMYYWAFALSSSSATNPQTNGGVLTDASTTNSMPYNQSVVRAGIAGNAMSGGVLPSTLGTLNTTASYATLPYWIVEPN